MSYILDALKRSDLHRDMVSEPSAPSAERTAILPLRGPDVSRLAPLLMAVAALGAAAILTLHTGHDHATLSAPDTVASAARPISAAPAVKPADAAKPAGAATAQPRAAKPAPETDKSQAAKQPAAQAAKAAAPAAPKAAPATKTITPVPPAHATAADGTAADGPAPLYADLPLAERKAIPHLHVDVHTWAESPKKRFVMLNGQIYHQGDTTREGPVVELIEPDGVVLSYHGKRYKLLR